LLLIVPIGRPRYTNEFAFRAPRGGEGALVPR